MNNPFEILFSCCFAEKGKEKAEQDNRERKEEEKIKKDGQESMIKTTTKKTILCMSRFSMLFFSFVMYYLQPSFLFRLRI